MRIAFAVFDDIPDGGAVAHRVLMLAAGLASRGHGVHIMAPYRFAAGPLSAEINGVQVHWGAQIERGAAQTLAGRCRKRYLMYQTTRRLLSRGLDWLILYDIGLEGLPFVLLAKLSGVKVAADNCDLCYLAEQKSLMGMFYVISDRLGHLLVTPRLDLNLAISSHIAADLRAKAPLVPQVRVPAPVDVDRFKKRPQAAAAFKERMGLPKEVPVIGYFGSVWAVKGLEVLLQAARKLLSQGKSFKLLITGHAAKNAHLLQCIEDLGLRDQVCLTGYLSTEELISAMSVPDILVEPKIEVEENRGAFPQKLAEYLAMGIPVVASAIGDIPAFLHDGENALLCRPGETDSLAQALARLMDDAALRKKLGQNARETARRHFDCRIIAQQIEAAIQEES